MVMGITAKHCDSCKLAPAVLFCRSDAVFLCLTCDADIHKLGIRHERVWICEVCEQAPAVVTCKADAATLCVTCDADIHSANPLARRHERVPVESFFNSAGAMVKSSSATFNFLISNGADIGVPSGTRKDDGEAASWLLMNQSLNSKLIEGEQLKSEDMFFSEMDSFLDFEYSDPVGRNDSVVPVQTKQAAAAINHSNENCFNIDFCVSKINSFSYPSRTVSHSISSSSLDVGIVPDGNSGNSLSEISYSFGRNIVEPCLSVSATAEQAVPLCGLDREAKVLRYREKKKNRRFEKTIRYASRKAYAETRPRIKGRFAKRSDTHSDVDRIYSVSANFLAEHQYGIVPSF